MILSAVAKLSLMVQLITCPVNEHNAIKTCMADQGYGNYELLGPFDDWDSNEEVYVGYLDEDNQINIRFPWTDRYTEGRTHHKVSTNKPPVNTPCVYTKTTYPRSHLSAAIQAWHKGARVRYSPNKHYYDIGDIVTFKYIWNVGTETHLIRGRVKVCALPEPTTSD